MTEEKKSKQKQAYCKVCGDPIKNGEKYCHLCGPRANLGALNIKPVYKGVRAHG